MKDKYIGKYDSVFKELLEKREEQRLIDKIRTESERDKCLRKMQEVIDGLTGDTMKAIDIAQYIISNNLIDNLRLNKILYYCQHESLKRYNKPIFYDEILAYKYGAVVANVYYRYNYFPGYIPIKYDVDIPKEAKDIVKYVIDKFDGVPTWDLVKINQSGVWKEIYNGGKGERLPIPLEMIKNEVV